MSHQLLIAAAIGKQFREITMADHSGHVVPGGADPTVPLRYRPFDARSETSLSTTEAMARSFRNWANREKRNRFRSRSHSPETVALSSRTTGPEDSPSGSSSDSSLTDDDAPPADGPGIAGPVALRAVVYDPLSDEDDILEAGDELGGLADLDFDDVSDEVMATAYAMLAAAEHAQGKGDWADTLAETVLKILLAEEPITPSTTPSPDGSLSLSSGSDTDTDADKDIEPPVLYWNSEAETASSDTDSNIKLQQEVKKALKNFKIVPGSKKHGNAKKQTMKATAPQPKHSSNKYMGIKGLSGKKGGEKTQTEILQGVQKAIKHLNKQQQKQQQATPEKSPASFLQPKPKDPTKTTPTKTTPTKAAPTKAAPTKAAPTKAAPTKAAPTKAAPTKAAPTKSKVPGGGKVAIEPVKQQPPPPSPPPPPPPPNKGPTVPPGTPDPDDGKGPSHRAPHKPAAPIQSVYDPTWWRVNHRDPDDGLWASEVLPPKQPTDKMETGFVTWAEQETRFPRLDSRLKLQYLPNAVIFEPWNVDNQTWDPLNRAITEPKTGARMPVRLGPATVHSLARWRASEFGIEYSLDPVRQPDNPSVEDKKRPLPSTTLSKPKGTTTKKKKKTGGAAWNQNNNSNNNTTTSNNKGSGTATATGIGTGTGKGKNVSFASGVKANMALATEETPIASTNNPAAVASVFYPLKSPNATSISKSHPGGQNESAYPSGYAAVASSSGVPGPSTLYPHYQTETPTVALYEHSSATTSTSTSTSSSSSFTSEEDSSGDEQDGKPAPFLQELHAVVTPNTNGKRIAGEEELAGPPTKKRQTTTTTTDFAPPPAAGFAGSSSSGGSSDSEKENGVGSSAELEAFEAVAKEFLARHQGASGQDADKPFLSPASGGAAKKSVRFDVNEGPSPGMRYGARRALGRYGLTSLRRGQLGPYR
ncbi:hypothetical protein F4859DRAFT_40274 [Xylaria cf. heliscus]|nr:hypothetical protein F4859DRAFT_40274 [Xylaria cf. heliscus]